MIMVRERDKGALRIPYALKRATTEVSLGTDRFQSSMGFQSTLEMVAMSTPEMISFINIIIS